MTSDDDDEVEDPEDHAEVVNMDLDPFENLLQEEVEEAVFNRLSTSPDRVWIDYGAKNPAHIFSVAPSGSVRVKTMNSDAWVMETNIKALAGLKEIIAAVKRAGTHFYMVTSWRDGKLWQGDHRWGPGDPQSSTFDWDGLFARSE